MPIPIVQQTLATILFSINNPPYTLVPVNIVQKKSISSGSGITNLTGTTWLINSTPTLPNSEAYYNIAFNSNGNSYTTFAFGATEIVIDLIRYSNNGVGVSAYENNTWTNEAYRTIAITGGTDATNSTLISWLQTAATFVSGDSLSPARLLPTIPPTTLISFTISGVTYEAEEGMTWYEWVNSEYNTNGYTCTNASQLISPGNSAHYSVGTGSNYVYKNDVITPNCAYTLMGGGSN